jgi:probable rRNA maturation factor
MLAALDLEAAELSVLLTDDPTIFRLNSHHRQKKQPTDVLAFPLLAPGAEVPEGAALGDIVISLDTAQRHAARGGLELLEEIRALLAHGVLHLLGYDHKTDAEERRMNEVAVRLADASRQRGTPRSIPRPPPKRPSRKPAAKRRPRKLR